MENNPELRKEIELIIKTSDIDKKCFFEVNKSSYQSIQNRVVAKFINTYDC